MTIASLVIRLQAETAEFHRQMESVARRVEQTGRRITRAGLEISKAISLPIIAAGLLAFHAALEESARHFGPLFVAFQQLKGAMAGLWRDVGTALTPLFLQLIDVLRGGIAWVEGLVQAFNRLSPNTKRIIIDVLLFLAALGPTIVAVGGLVRAIGAIGTALGILFSPIGLIVVAVLGLAAAGLYVATHWEQVKLRMLLVWTAIEEAFFDGVRVLLTALDILTLGLTKVTGVTDYLRGKLDAFADKTLAKAAAHILELEAALLKAGHTGQGFGNSMQSITDIMNEFFDAGQVALDQQDIFGAAFDVAGARARIYGQAIDKLTKLHVPLGEVLTKDGMTLLDMGRIMNKAQIDSENFAQGVGALTAVYKTATAAAEEYDAILKLVGGNSTLAAKIAVQEASIISAVMGGLADAIAAIGERLGAIFAGTVHGFRGFGRALEGIIGGVLETAGKAAIAIGLIAIAYGVLGNAIRSFAAHPGLAIGAGIALVAIGSALSAAASKSFSSIGGGDAGGGDVSAAGPGSYSGGSSSNRNVYVPMPSGRNLYDWSDPQEVAQFKEFLEQLSGKNIIFLPAAPGRDLNWATP